MQAGRQVEQGVGGRPAPGTPVPQSLAQRKVLAAQQNALDQIGQITNRLAPDLRDKRCKRPARMQISAGRRNAQGPDSMMQSAFSNMKVAGPPHLRGRRGGPAPLRRTRGESSDALASGPAKAAPSPHPISRRTNIASWFANWRARSIRTWPTSADAGSPELSAMGILGGGQQHQTGPLTRCPTKVFGESLWRGFGPWVP